MVLLPNLEVIANSSANVKDHKRFVEELPRPSQFVLHAGSSYSTWDEFFSQLREEADRVRRRTLTSRLKTHRVSATEAMQRALDISGYEKMHGIKLVFDPRINIRIEEHPFRDHFDAEAMSQAIEAEGISALSQVQSTWKDIKRIDLPALTIRLDPHYLVRVLQAAYDIFPANRTLMPYDDRQEKSPWLSHRQAELAFFEYLKVTQPEHAKTVYEVMKKYTLDHQKRVATPNGDVIESISYPSLDDLTHLGLRTLEPIPDNDTFTQKARHLVANTLTKLQEAGYVERRGYHIFANNTYFVLGPELYSE